LLCKKNCGRSPVAFPLCKNRSAARPAFLSAPYVYAIKLTFGESTKLLEQNSKKNKYNLDKIDRYIVYIDNKLVEYSRALAENIGDSREIVHDKIITHRKGKTITRIFRGCLMYIACNLRRNGNTLTRVIPIEYLMILLSLFLIFLPLQGQFRAIQWKLTDRFPLGVI